MAGQSGGRLRRMAESSVSPKDDIEAGGFELVQQVGAGQKPWIMVLVAPLVSVTVKETLINSNKSKVTL